MAIREVIDIKHDQLIGGPEIPILLKNVTLTAGTAMKRGTLMTVTGTATAATAKAAVATAKAAVANAILSCDVDDKATVATVYVSGRFHREYLIAASEDTVDAHEEELRNAGIFLTSVH